MTPENLLKRSIAGLVLLAFCLNTILPPAYAQSTPAVSKPAVLPGRLGKVEESFQGSSGKKIFYIQDAHDSLEAQENIAKMIHHLVEHAGVTTVFEEGYEGPVPTDKFFGKIPDKKIREKTAYFLMDKLRLGGAEYAHITRTKNFELIGADNLKLHKENTAFYQESSEHQPETESALTVLDTEIRALTQRYFTKDLKTWMVLKEKSERGEITVIDYLKRMNGLPAPVSEFKTISRILAMASGKERAQDDIDVHVLFSEMNQMEERFAQSQLSETRDRELFHYYQSLQLFKRLNRLEVTEEEFEAVREKIKTFSTDRIAKFIAEQSGHSVVLPKIWEKTIQSAIRFYEAAKERDTAIEKALLSVERGADSGQEKAALNAKRQTLSSAILVFGGFHKENIKSILRKNGFSYEVISPAITSLSPKHQNYYKQLMRLGYDSGALPVLAAKATTAARELAFPETVIQPMLDRISSLALKTSGKDGSSSLAEMDLLFSRTEMDLEPRNPAGARYEKRDIIREVVKALDSKTVSDRSYEAFLLKYGFQHVRRGTYHSRPLKLYFYNKGEEFSAETKESALKKKEIAETLTKAGMLNPETRWGIFQTRPGYYALYAVSPEMEAVSKSWLADGVNPPRKDWQPFMRRKDHDALNEDTGHWHYRLVTAPESHVNEWIHRLIRDFNPSSEIPENVEALTLKKLFDPKGPGRFLDLSEAMSAINWGWDKETGILYPVDIEVLALSQLSASPVTESRAEARQELFELLQKNQWIQEGTLPEKEEDADAFLSAAVIHGLLENKLEAMRKTNPGEQARLYELTAKLNLDVSANHPAWTEAPQKKTKDFDPEDFKILLPRAKELASQGYQTQVIYSQKTYVADEDDEDLDAAYSAGEVYFVHMREVRALLRDVAESRNLPATWAADIGLIAHELIFNMLEHAHAGVFGVKVIEKDGEPVMELTGWDMGGGIHDPERLRQESAARNTGGIGFRTFGDMEGPVFIESEGKTWQRVSGAGFQFLNSNSEIHPGAGTKITMQIPLGFIPHERRLSSLTEKSDEEKAESPVIQGSRVRVSIPEKMNSQTRRLLLRQLEALKEHESINVELPAWGNSRQTIFFQIQRWSASEYQLRTYTGLPESSENKQMGSIDFKLAKGEVLIHNLFPFAKLDQEERKPYRSLKIPHSAVWLLSQVAYHKNVPIYHEGTRNPAAFTIYKTLFANQYYQGRAVWKPVDDPEFPLYAAAGKMVISDGTGNISVTLGKSSAGTGFYTVTDTERLNFKGKTVSVDEQGFVYLHETAEKRLLGRTITFTNPIRLRGYLHEKYLEVQNPSGIRHENRSIFDSAAELRSAGGEYFKRAEVLEGELGSKAQNYFDYSPGREELHRIYHDYIQAYLDLMLKVEQAIGDPQLLWIYPFTGIDAVLPYAVSGKVIGMEYYRPEGTDLKGYGIDNILENYLSLNRDQVRKKLANFDYRYLDSTNLETYQKLRDAHQGRAMLVLKESGFGKGYTNKAILADVAEPLFNSVLKEGDQVLILSKEGLEKFEAPLLAAGFLPVVRETSKSNQKIRIRTHGYESIIRLHVPDAYAVFEKDSRAEARKVPALYQTALKTAYEEIQEKLKTGWRPQSNRGSHLRLAFANHDLDVQIGTALSGKIAIVTHRDTKFPIKALIDLEDTNHILMAGYPPDDKKAALYFYSGKDNFSAVITGDAPSKVNEVRRYPAIESFERQTLRNFYDDRARRIAFISGKAMNGEVTIPDHGQMMYVRQGFKMWFPNKVSAPVKWKDLLWFHVAGREYEPTIFLSEPAVNGESHYLLLVPMGSRVALYNENGFVKYFPYGKTVSGVKDRDLLRFFTLARTGSLEARRENRTEDETTAANTVKRPEPAWYGRLRKALALAEKIEPELSRRSKDSEAIWNSFQVIAKTVQEDPDFSQPVQVSRTPAEYISLIREAVLSRRMSMQGTGATRPVTVFIDGDPGVKKSALSALIAKELGVKTQILHGNDFIDQNEESRHSADYWKSLQAALDGVSPEVECLVVEGFRIMDGEKFLHRGEQPFPFDYKIWLAADAATRRKNIRAYYLMSIKSFPEDSLAVSVEQSMLLKLDEKYFLRRIQSGWFDLMIEFSEANRPDLTPYDLHTGRHETRSENKFYSDFELEKEFGESLVGPRLSRGPKHPIHPQYADFLFDENGKKIAVRMIYSNFIFRPLDEMGNEIPDRVIKVTYKDPDNEMLLEEARHLLKIQAGGSDAGTPVILHLGLLKEGGAWIEMKSIPSARSLDREIFGSVPRLFDVLIRAGEIVANVNRHKIAHGDLKPHQFLINNEQELQLIDFGNSVAIPAEHEVHAATPQYVPRNEQGDAIYRDYAEDTDVYSFIMMITELLEHQIKTPSTEVSAAVEKMRDEYLSMILKSWSFERLGTTWLESYLHEAIRPLPREKWPKTMEPVLKKLRSDFKIIQEISARHESRPEEEAVEGLFNSGSVQDLIGDIRNHWGEIVQHGAFVFDVDGTILSKGKKSFGEEPELLERVVKLLKADVQVVIISGNSAKRLVRVLYEPIREKLKEQGALSFAQNFTLYGSGGGFKFNFNEAGEALADEAYNLQHQLEPETLQTFAGIITRHGRERFVRLGVTEEVIAGWPEMHENWGAMRFENLWEVERGIDTHEETKILELREQGGLVTFPFMDVRGVRYADSGEIAGLSSFTLSQMRGDQHFHPFRNLMGIILAEHSDLAGKVEMRISGSHLDVTPRGVNKTVAIRDFIETKIKTKFPLEIPKGRGPSIFYFGDEVFEGGNDLPIAKEPLFAEWVRVLAVNKKQVPPPPSFWIGHGVKATEQFLSAVLAGRNENRNSEPLLNLPEMVRIAERFTDYAQHGVAFSSSQEKNAAAKALAQFMKDNLREFAPDPSVTENMNRLLERLLALLSQPAYLMTAGDDDEVHALAGFVFMGFMNRTNAKIRAFAASSQSRLPGGFTMEALANRLATARDYFEGERFSGETLHKLLSIVLYENLSSRAVNVTGHSQIPSQAFPVIAAKFISQGLLFPRTIGDIMTLEQRPAVETKNIRAYFDELVKALFSGESETHQRKSLDLLMDFRRDYFVHEMVATGIGQLIFQNNFLQLRHFFRFQPSASLNTTGRTLVRHKLLTTQLIESYQKIHSAMLGQGILKPELTYDFSGPDISTALLLTDAQTLHFNDAIPFLLNVNGQAPESLRFKEIYFTDKATKGYSNGSLIESIGSIRLLMEWELEALGARNVRFEKNPGNPKQFFITFDWSYDGEAANLKSRKIIYTEQSFDSAADFRIHANRLTTGMYLRKADLGRFEISDVRTPVIISFDHAESRAGYKRTPLAELAGPGASSLYLEGADRNYADLRKGSVYVLEEKKEEKKPEVPHTWKAGDKAKDTETGDIVEIESVFEDGRIKLVGSNGTLSRKIFAINYEPVTGERHENRTLDRMTVLSQPPVRETPYSELLRELNPGTPKPWDANLNHDFWVEPMRYPELYRHLQRLAKEKEEKLNVLILGPGRARIPDSNPARYYSPQMVEILAALKGHPADITVVDADPSVLKTAVSPHWYSLSLKAFTSALRLLPFAANLKAMLGSRTTKQIRSLLLSGQHAFKLNIPSEAHTVSVFQGYFETLNFGEDQADAIVATSSLTYALQSAGTIEESLDLLARVVKALKPGGQLLVSAGTLTNGIFLNPDKSQKSDFAEWMDQKELRRAEIIEQVEKALQQRLGFEIQIGEKIRDLRVLTRSARSEMRSGDQALNSLKVSLRKLMETRDASVKTEQMNQIAAAVKKASPQNRKQFSGLLARLLDNKKESEALREIQAGISVTDAGQRARFRALYEHLYNEKGILRKNIPVLLTSKDVRDYKNEFTVTFKGKKTNLKIESLTYLTFQERRDIQNIFPSANLVSFFDKDLRSGNVPDNSEILVVRNPKNEIVAYAWSFFDPQRKMLGLAAIGVRTDYRGKVLAMRLLIRQLEGGVDRGMTYAKTHIGIDGRRSRLHWRLLQYGAQIQGLILESDLPEMGISVHQQQKANAEIQNAQAGGYPKNKAAIDRVLKRYQNAQIIMKMDLSSRLILGLKARVLEVSGNRAEARSEGRPLSRREFTAASLTAAGVVSFAAYVGWNLPPAKKPPVPRTPHSFIGLPDLDESQPVVLEDIDKTTVARAFAKIWKDPDHPWVRSAQATYEMTHKLMDANPDFLKTRKVTVLYPGSDAHAASLDIAHELIQQKRIDHAEFIFTEINEDSLYYLREILKQLKKHGFYENMEEETEKLRAGEEGSETLFKLRYQGKNILVRFALKRSGKDFYRDDYLQRANIYYNHDPGLGVRPHQVFSDLLEHLSRNPASVPDLWMMSEGFYGRGWRVTDEVPGQLREASVESPAPAHYHFRTDLFSVPVSGAGIFDAQVWTVPFGFGHREGVEEERGKYLYPMADIAHLDRTFIQALFKSPALRSGIPVREQLEYLTRFLGAFGKFEVSPIEHPDKNSFDSKSSGEEQKKYERDTLTFVREFTESLPPDELSRKMHLTALLAIYWEHQFKVQEALENAFKNQDLSFVQTAREFPAAAFVSSEIAKSPDFFSAFLAEEGQKDFYLGRRLAAIGALIFLSNPKIENADSLRRFVRDLNGQSWMDQLKPLEEKAKLRSESRDEPGKLTHPAHPALTPQEFATEIFQKTHSVARHIDAEIKGSPSFDHRNRITRPGTPYADYSELMRLSGRPYLNSEQRSELNTLLKKLIAGETRLPFNRLPGEEAKALEELEKLFHVESLRNQLFWKLFKVQNLLGIPSHEGHLAKPGLGFGDEMEKWEPFGTSDLFALNRDSGETLETVMQTIESLGRELRAVNDPLARVLPDAQSWVAWHSLHLMNPDEAWVRYVEALEREHFSDTLLIHAGMKGLHVRQQADVADLQLYPLLISAALKKLDEAVKDMEKNGRSAEARARTASASLFSLVHIFPRNRTGALDFETYRTDFQEWMKKVREKYGVADPEGLFQRAVTLFPDLLKNSDGSLPLYLEFIDKRLDAEYSQTGSEVMDILSIWNEWHPGQEITVLDLISGSQNPNVERFLRDRQKPLQIPLRNHLLRVRDALLDGSLLVRAEAREPKETKTPPAMESVLFVDGAAKDKSPERRAQELAVLAAENPKRLLVVYESRKTEAGAVTVSSLLKTFNSRNIKIVPLPFAEAVKPYQFRGQINLVHYAANEDEAVLVQSSAGERLAKKLTSFVGDAGALGHGLKYLEAVKLKEQEARQSNKPLLGFVAPDIEFRNGHYLVSPQASASMLLLQQAEFAIAFARAA